MDVNPYEPPKVAAGGWTRSLTGELAALRSAVALLATIVVVQWVCHFLTAVAMFTYMDAARVGPTAKTLDAVFYGLGCVGFTAVLAICAGIAAKRTLRTPESTSKNS